MNAPSPGVSRARPLDRLFEPRSIAVAGATTTARKLGNVLIERLAAGFQGKLYPVHPTHPEIAGLRAYPDLAAIPEPIDLLVALLPGRQLLELVEACAPGRVHVLLAVPAGFAEAGQEGIAMQAALASAAAARGMRLVGPNCMGMINAAAGINASLAPELPPGGRGLSIVTQSGGFAIAVTMYANDHQLPVAKIVDLGNMADLQLAEVLDHLTEDSETEVIGLFLEAAGHSDDHARALARAVARKPVVLTRLGRTAVGRAASHAHIGPAGPPVALPSPATRNLSIARTGAELLDLAKALTWQPRAAGRRIGLLTATGGIATELTDLCVEHGLEVPVLSDGLQQAIARLLPPFAVTRNPIDLTPIWWQFADIYPRIIELLLQSSEIDGLIVTVTDVPTEIDEFATALRDALAEAPHRTGKPAFVFWGSRDHVLANMRLLEAARIPCYRQTEPLVRVAAAMAAVPETVS